MRGIVTSGLNDLASICQNGVCIQLSFWSIGPACRAISVQVRVNHRKHSLQVKSIAEEYVDAIRLLHWVSHQIVVMDEENLDVRLISDPRVQSLQMYLVGLLHFVSRCRPPCQ
jgi:hypothetical protein